MGKRKKKTAGEHCEKQKKKDECDLTPKRNYEDIIRENSDFESYYKTQGIVPEDQWELFMTTLKKNLPVVFRITGSKVEAKRLLETIKEDFFKEILDMCSESDYENKEERKELLHCLPFYPDNLAWQLQLSMEDIRRSKAYFKLHNFLVVETNFGSVSRQGVVSIVPPLVLDVKPSHKVLDMCAAVGSKTAQLIEMLHSDEANRLPKGFVIANDLDHNRCYMLVYQAERLNSAITLIMNHDASMLPNLMFTQPDGTQTELKFDRILADVPCSGDGTMRKNPDIWCKWSPANGNNLHGVQYRIARRGLELLAVGGRMVYSTCSLNPVENEAVLHRLLLETEDSVHIVEGRHLVPGLICDPGVSQWLPASTDLQYYKSWEDVPEEWQSLVRQTMFPPKAEDAAKFHFERCMRILPHHQDTDGFFVAILEKVKPLPWESCKNNSDAKEGTVEPSLQDEAGKYKDDNLEPGKRALSDDQKPQGSRRKRKKAKGFTGFKEGPFGFFKDDQDDVWLLIKKFYDISDELNPKNLIIRNLRRRKIIYYISPEIRNVVLSNKNQIRLLNTGVKAFTSYEKWTRRMNLPYRIEWAGLQTLINYIGDSRRVPINKEDLVTILLQNNNSMAEVEIVELHPDIQERLKHLETGSCVLIYERKESDNPIPFKLNIVGWKNTMSLRAHVSLSNAIHYLRLLGADCSMFEKNKFKEHESLSAEETEVNIEPKMTIQDEEKTNIENSDKLESTVMLGNTDGPEATVKSEAPIKSVNIESEVTDDEILIRIKFMERTN